MRRVALVTGGTRGIGLGVARSLSKEGFDLALCGVREKKQVSAVVRELGALYVAADLADRGARRRLIDSVRRRFGRLDVLVNNAGVAPRTREDILQATEESFDRLIGINLKGPYFLTQLAARWMIEQKRRGGCIVNVSSVSAQIASVNRGDYCMTKAAITMATRLWACRLAEYGIAVYEIQPGIIQTDMTAPAKEKYDRLIAQGALLQSRWGTVEDVGRAVASLARGDFPYSTGHVFLVDGGMTVQRL